VKDLDDSALPPARFDAPPPSSELLDAVQNMKPVVTRTRFGALAALGVLAASYAGVLLAVRPHRADLGALPLAWVAGAAAIWGLAVVLPLVAALVPGRQDVLASPARASRAGGAALATVFLFSLLATVQVPGVSLHPADAHMTLVQSCLHCAFFIVKMAALPFLVLGVFLLRRLAPVGGARIGLALGAAGGALGGFVLVFNCPFADTAHVVFGHVGGAALVAAACALLVRFANREPPGARRPQAPKGANV
jgi:hypothetical protein